MVYDKKMPDFTPPFRVFFTDFSRSVVILLLWVWYSWLIKRKTTDKALAPYGDQRYNGIWVSTNEVESEAIFSIVGKAVFRKYR